MKNNNQRTHALLQFCKTYSVSIFVAFSMCSCLDTCNNSDLYGKTHFLQNDELFHKVNVSLTPTNNVDLKDLRGGTSIENGAISVSIPITIKNEDSFKAFSKQDLERVKLKITELNNVGKVMYVSKAEHHPRDKKMLLPTDFSVIEGNSISLLKLLGIFQLQAMPGRIERSTILELIPQDVSKPASLTLELEGSINMKKALYVIWKSPVDLELQVANRTNKVISLNSQSLNCTIFDVLVGNKSQVDLSPEMLQLCFLKITDPDNIAGISFVDKYDEDTDEASFKIMKFDSLVAIRDMLEAFDPQGIADQKAGTIWLVAAPREPAKQSSFVAELWDHSSKIGSWKFNVN